MERFPVPEGGTSKRLELDARNRRYYNLPSEVRAFKRNVAEELRRELERSRGEDADWIPSGADRVMDLLGKSVTWDRVKPYLTKKNRREFLQMAASVVRKHKSDLGGRVASLWLGGDASLGGMIGEGSR